MAPNVATTNMSQQLTGAGFRARIENNVRTLYRSFLDIQGAAIDDQEETGHEDAKIQAAIIKQRMETNAQDLIRICEDTLQMIRQMQELWLFSDADTRTKDLQREEVTRLAELLQALHARKEVHIRDEGQ
ncbi:hypothetical protein EJ06DRAFT_529758 [Trichodelitschia bisporula]|uniref:Mediator of RNA polymerase II transcription subunit 22 n=1 Tax=Trichodelitschia bisporula TaxID=703511 RepID=A0A6G1HX37_9PEZI|nr:hypothetical protein EJ06DRAFT_529758 [Trichodelitschia bisporula]